MIVPEPRSRPLFELGCYYPPVSAHDSALVPSTTGMLMSPDVAKNGRKVDVGLLAESLLYYERAFVVVGSLEQFLELAGWFKEQGALGELTSLLSDQTVRLYSYDFLTTTIEKDGALSIWNVEGPATDVGMFERDVLNAPELDALFSRSRDRVRFRRAAQQGLVCAKANVFGAAVANARADARDLSRTQRNLQLIYDEVCELVCEPHQPVRVSRVEHEGRMTYSYSPGLDFLQARLGSGVPVGRTFPFHAPALCNRAIETSVQLGCDLYLGSPLSSLVGDKLVEIAQATADKQRLLHRLEHEVSFPDVRAAVNDGLFSISQVLQARKKSKPFRDWLTSSSHNDSAALVAYHSEVARELGWKDRVGKVLRLFGTVGGAAAGAMTAGPIGAMAVAAGSEATNFVVTKALNLQEGWRPIVFGRWLEQQIGRV